MEHQTLTAEEALAQIKAAAEHLKEQGHQNLRIEGLLTYLANTKRVSPEQANINLERLKIDHDHKRQWEHAMFRSVIDSGQIALKGSILIGGGAVAALLAFASSAWKSLTPQGLDFLGWAVLLLALGVLFCGLASGFTYLSQACYARGHNGPANCREDVIGDRLRWGAIGLVLSSYALYLISAILVLKVMGSFKVVYAFPIG